MVKSILDIIKNQALSTKNKYHLPVKRKGIVNGRENSKYSQKNN